MNFIERIKKDKNFRIKAILIFVVAVLLIGNIPGEVKKEAPLQSTCDNANGLALTTQISTCTQSGCAVTAGNYQSGLGFLECVQQGAAGIALYCNNNPSANPVTTFMAKDLNAANSLCGPAAKAVDTGESFCFKTLYTCVDVPKEERCTSSTQKTLAGFLDSADFADEFTCKQKYYAVAFGGGFLAMFMLMAII